MTPHGDLQVADRSEADDPRRVSYPAAAGNHPHLLEVVDLPARGSLYRISGVDSYRQDRSAAGAGAVAPGSTRGSLPTRTAGRVGCVLKTIV
jgi:hypothetical protein